MVLFFSSLLSFIFIVLPFLPSHFILSLPYDALLSFSLFSLILLFTISYFFLHFIPSLPLTSFLLFLFSSLSCSFPFYISLCFILFSASCFSLPFQTCAAHIDKNDRGLFGCCTIQENGRSLSQSACLQQTNSKADSRSNLKYSPLEPTDGCWVVSPVAEPVPKCCLFQLPPGTCVWGPHSHGPCGC